MGRWGDVDGQHPGFFHGGAHLLGVSGGVLDLGDLMPLGVAKPDAGGTYAVRPGVGIWFMGKGF